MNVALTRAQHALFIVGHANVMQQNHRWAQLIAHARAISRSTSATCSNPRCATKVVLMTTCPWRAVCAGAQCSTPRRR